MKQEERVAKDIQTNKRQKLNDAKTNKERERSGLRETRTIVIDN